jgi:Ca2+-transporting ATPase
MPLPLQPVQILWVNLLTDGLPALALTTEREEADIMRRPPRPPGESVFAGAVWQRIAVMGLLIAGLCLVVQAYGLANDLAHWQTMVFTVLTFSQALLALAFRSDRESVFAIGIFSNPAMVGSVLLVVSLQLAIIYVPPLQQVFGTSALTFGELGLCASAALLVFGMVEGWKAVRRWLPPGASRFAAERGTV